MPRKSLIYIIGGSIRNRADQEAIVDNVKKIKNEAFLYEYIENLGRAKKISNSEGCSIAAAYGALNKNANVKYLQLNKYFLRSGRNRNVKELFKILKKADGIIFALPVYFGDRSSLFHELIEKMKLENLDFSGKVFGFVSVGAKRNGGQETTIIFAMQNITELGGLVVGNGPPTSQYGGTTVGGNIGTMEDDYFGIMTSQGTGRKVVETVEILKKGIDHKQAKTKKVKISFFVLQDSRSILKSHIENIIKRSKLKNVDFQVIDVTKYKLNRCFACNICPNGEAKEDYKCINYKDDMKKLHDKIISNDGIIIAGLSLHDLAKVKSIYQKFIERSRYIRRDDFRLTNILSTAFSLNEIGTNNLFNLRAMTSFIRHNTIIHRGIHNYLDTGKIIDCESVPILTSFVDYSRIISIGREKVEIGSTRYSPIGY
jgi:multimeric flavodoxin WrbA